LQEANDECCKDHDELMHYIKENEDIILNKKNEIIKIMNAFMKAGTDLDKEIIPKMKYKNYYMPSGESKHS
jgi:hypothetical protein